MTIEIVDRITGEIFRFEITDGQRGMDCRDWMLRHFVKVCQRVEIQEREARAWGK